MISRWVLAAVVVLAVAAAVIYGVHSAEPTIAVGKPAPDFSAINVATGKKVSLYGDYRGQVTLVNIWATWCGPCRDEIPALQKLYQEFGPKGLHIAAVSIDSLSGAEVSAFMKGFGVTFDVLHDSAGVIETIYLSEKFPETFLVDRQGRITRIDYGAKEWGSDEVRTLVSSLLAQPGS